MMNRAIFQDEDIIRDFIKKFLKTDFENHTIEEIIDMTKTAKYKDFERHFKAKQLSDQLINFHKKESLLINFYGSIYPDKEMRLGKVGEKISFK